MQALRVLDCSRNEGLERIAALVRRLFDVPFAQVLLSGTGQPGVAQHAGPLAAPAQCGQRRASDHDDGDDQGTDESAIIVFNAAAGGRLAVTLPDGQLRDIRFYAACPLRNEAGCSIGMLALADHEPRRLTQDELALLRELAGLAEQQLRALISATTDELTRIPNRRGFLRLAGQMLGACGRLQQPAALLAFDLDGLKKINDGLGHAAGDHVLQEFARCLLRACRDSDALGRVGGDEFCMLLADTDATGAGAVLEQLQRQVALSNLSGAGAPPIAFRAGVALHAPGATPAIDLLLAEADRWLREAKSARTA